jgi:hypothetical protein
VIRSDVLPVGHSEFGIFFGGAGRQSDVEVGIAQHDVEFKWLLKLSSDGKSTMCAVLFEYTLQLILQ